MSKKVIRIGGASGFWGDSTIAAPQLLAGGKLDYLVFDYLAEITMSIMARSRAKEPEQGYAHDFVTQVLKNSLPELARQGVKVVSNAGGVNPIACAKAIEALVREMGLHLKVATVVGDDLIGRVDEMRAAGTREMFSGAPMPAKFMSVNAYLGGFPIAQALAAGADIVITGRVVDSAVTLGPCIHEFGWRPEDYDQLAQGSLAGHIIECGAQATGGLFTDWDTTGPWENIGYPIAEVEGDGAFTVSKADGTGGLVSRQTVAEQLVYEIGDPQAYILPDVVCDFSQVKIEDTGKDRARVGGARGSQPTDRLKVSATYMDGFRLGTYVSIRGMDAPGKAKKTADAVLKRTSGILKRMGAPDFSEVNIEIIGTEAGYGPHSRVSSPREVMLKLAAKHASEAALGLLLRELTSSGTSMAPGTSGMGGNRAKPSPVVRLFSCTVDRASVAPEVIVGDTRAKAPFSPGRPFDAALLVRPKIADAPAESGPTVEVPLVKIAHGRSGDKGNDSNIGIIARKPEFYPILRRELTAKVVRDYFSYLMDGDVERFDLPGLNAVNFLLRESLGGGGIASLRNDPQGKAYAQMLLDIPIRVAKALAQTL
jgi:hypothetical protein